MTDQQQAIEKAIKALGERENLHAELVRKQTDAKFNYDLKYSQEYLKAEGTEKAREAIAVVNSADELKVKLGVDAEVRILKTFMDDCRSVISARQSILSSEVKSGMIGGKWSA